jgi:hypothetical protein
MWLEANLISVGLGNWGVYCKSTWSLSHSRNVCLLALAITFCSLRWNQAKRLLKTCIQCCMILIPWALLPSRWMSRLAELHGNIVTHPQMPHQVVLSCIGWITPINPTSKFGPILYPMDTFHGNLGGGGWTTTFLKKKQKT